MLLHCGVGEDSWESLGLQGDPTSPSWRRSVLGVHWKNWCWSWNSNPLATSCEELTHWKRPWCWGRLRAGGEGDDRGWDGWIASPTQWRWVWVNSGNWWWTGRPGVLRFMGSLRVRHAWSNLGQTDRFSHPTDQNFLRLTHLGAICMAGKCKLFFWVAVFLVKTWSYYSYERKGGAQPLGMSNICCPSSYTVQT